MFFGIDYHDKCDHLNELSSEIRLKSGKTLYKTKSVFSLKKIPRVEIFKHFSNKFTNESTEIRKKLDNDVGLLPLFCSLCK